MIDNVNLTLLSGGLYTCDPTWNKARSGIDDCYKLYVPVSGRAMVETDAGEFEIRPGRVSFISGFRLVRQSCPKKMRVYWVHFVPESLYLRYLLDQLSPAVWWVPAGGVPSAEECRGIIDLFEDPSAEQSRLREDRAPSIVVGVEGLLLRLLGGLLARLDQGTVSSFHPQYFKLKPAIDFMHRHYAHAPSLEEISSHVHMAPNHFHRIFRKLFGVTPFDYMLHRRLTRACHLLVGSDLSIKEIAHEVGYEDPLYFSRVFGRRMHVSPSVYRSENAKGSD